MPRGNAVLSVMQSCSTTATVLRSTHLVSALRCAAMQYLHPGAPGSVAKGCRESVTSTDAARRSAERPESVGADLNLNFNRLTRRHFHSALRCYVPAPGCRLTGSPSYRRRTRTRILVDCNATDTQHPTACQAAPNKNRPPTSLVLLPPSVPSRTGPAGRVPRFAHRARHQAGRAVRP